MRRYAIVYAIVIGLGMLGMWSMLLATGQVPEVESEPVRLGFHLAAEAMTALTMIVGGVALARRLPWARTAYVLGCGMLFYTLVVSPGYYAQLGDLAFVAMFAVFAAGALVALVAVWREK